MQINPKLVKNQFKKSLDKYEENALVQAIMADKLIESLGRREFSSVLELGCGTGLLTKRLIQSVSYKKYYANDIVEKSKVYLDKILTDYVFLGGNAQRLQVNGKFDLIISNAMFQWFSDLEKALLYYQRMLNKGGTIAFTTFAPDNFKEIKSLTGLTLEYKTCEEIQLITEKFFTVKHIENFDYTLKFTNPLEILAHMKNTGVNALSTKHWGIKDVKDFCDRYKEEYPDLTLTYSPVIVVAEGRA